jgi:hypothetical protein
VSSIYLIKQVYFLETIVRMDFAPSVQHHRHIENLCSSHHCKLLDQEREKIISWLNHKRPHLYHNGTPFGGQHQPMLVGGAVKNLLLNAATTNNMRNN